MNKIVPDRKKIRFIMDKAGGEIEVSAYLTRKHRQNVSQFAIRMWYVRGVPEKYWMDLAVLADVSVDDLWRACGS